MAGYWEIWHNPSRNALASEDTEAEALKVVRDIVSEGASYTDLTMLFDDPDLDVEDLPSPVTGEDLARRAGAAGSSPIRRTA
jgi:hypothetical protein